MSEMQRRNETEIVRICRETPAAARRERMIAASSQPLLHVRRLDSMARKTTEDPRLTRLTAICLALPETERLLRGDHADFRIRGRVFVYYLDNHHGDGIVSVCCKSELGEHIDRAHRDPGRFYLPAYIGARGWFGLRLDRGKIDWREVSNVVERSFCLAAPKSVVKALENARA
jgi:hypothetical protein